MYICAVVVCRAACDDDLRVSSLGTLPPWTWFVTKHTPVLSLIKACVASRNIYFFIYNTLILSHINYCIMPWGYQCSRMMKEKAMRMVTLSKYNSHTEPLF